MEERTFTQPDDYSSFVLPSLLEGLHSPPKRTVLDLGPASSENVDQVAAYAKRCCKLFIASRMETRTGVRNTSTLSYLTRLPWQA